MGLLLFSFFLFTLQFNFKLKKPNVYWTWGRRIVGADGSIEHLVTSLNAQFGSYVKLTLSALILPENLVNFCSCCNYLVVNVVVTVQFYVIAPAHHFFLSSLFICNAIFVRPSFKNVIQSKVVFFKLFLAIHLSFSLSLSLSRPIMILSKSLPYFLHLRPPINVIWILTSHERSETKSVWNEHFLRGNWVIVIFKQNYFFRYWDLNPGSRLQRIIPYWMDYLLFYWFGFNQTSKYVNPNQ